MLCREQAQVVLDTPLISMEQQSPSSAQSGRWRTSSWRTPKISASLLLLYRCLAEAQIRIHLLVPAHIVLPRKSLLNRWFSFSIIREASEELHLPCWKILKSITCSLACSWHLSERGYLGTTWCWRSWIVLWNLFHSVLATSAFTTIIIVFNAQHVPRSESKMRTRAFLPPVYHADYPKVWQLGFPPDAGRHVGLKVPMEGRQRYEALSLGHPSLL